MNKPFNLRQFDLAEANWEFQSEQLSEIRRQVFLIGGDITASAEFDGQDDNAWHWLATSRSGQPIGTARLLPSGQIGHLAVLEEFRHRGIGKAILEAVIAGASRLGMPEVFVHTPPAAKSFYAKMDFSLQGNEFEEAGMVQVSMARRLHTEDTQSARRLTEQMSIKQFDTREAFWQDDADQLIRIRNEVFVKGQQVPLEIEQDGRDETAYHWLARDLDGLAVGTGRLLPDGHIGRMAVLENKRGQGIGFTILELAVQKARYLGFTQVSLNAQSYAQAFYEKAGFTVRGEEFMEAGIPHIEMYLDLAPARSVPQRGYPIDPAGAEAGYQGDGAEPEFILGKTDHSVLLRSESEFRNVSCDLVDQARISLRIWSPLLDHKLYDNEQFRDVVSRLARRHKRTEIQILLYDSHRIVKNGHLVLELARRLSSSIQMRIVHPDYRQLNHEYLLADDFGIIYRINYEVYEGFTNYYDKTEGNRLRREFTRAWETALHDPNLRQLKI